MKTIVVDDEKIALMTFMEEAKNIPELEVEGLFENAEEAVEYVKENKIDIAILDIEMQGIDGINLGNIFRRLNPKIMLIYITGYEKYAYEAIKLHAAAYLVKPFSSAQLEYAVETARLLSKRGKKKIFVRTFGHFDVFVDDEPIMFKSHKAKELLAEAGYTDTLDLGKYIIMYDGIDSEIAQSIQEDLKAVGVNVEIAIEEQSAAFKDINNGDYSIVTSYANFGDQITGLTKVLNTKLIGNYNYANYGNADLDNMTEEALAETDAAKRLDVTRNIVTLLQDEVPVIKLSNDVKFHAYNKDLDCTIMYNCFYRFDEWGWK